MEKSRRSLYYGPTLDSRKSKIIQLLLLYVLSPLAFIGLLVFGSLYTLDAKGQLVLLTCSRIDEQWD